jgi:hypothetical protein
MPFTTNPQTQVDIEILTNALAALGPDQLLTYPEMSRLVGYDVRVRPWPMLKARDLVERDSGQRFGTVRGEGFCKLTADQLPGIGMSARRRVGRIAKRASTRMTKLRYNDVDRRLQGRLDAERSLLGAIGAVASTKGDHVASITKTGPVVAEKVFDYIRRDSEKD